MNIPRDLLPRQDDATSRGVFACAYAALKVNQIPLQDGVVRMRLLIANCILKSKSFILWGRSPDKRRRKYSPGRRPKRGRPSIEGWNVIKPTTDQLLNINRHPNQEADADMLRTIITSTSSFESSDEEYDEVIIFETEARNRGSQYLKGTGEVHDDDDLQEITFV